jgi:Ni/Co efflux regulator RcnB
MKKIVLALIVLSSLFAHSTIAQKDSQASTQEAIKSLITNNEQAWNRHDAKALAEQYHTDATWVNWFGAYYRAELRLRSTIKPPIRPISNQLSLPPVPLRI